MLNKIKNVANVMGDALMFGGTLVVIISAGLLATGGLFECVLDNALTSWALGAPMFVVGLSAITLVAALSVVVLGITFRILGWILDDIPSFIATAITVSYVGWLYYAEVMPYTWGYGHGWHEAFIALGLGLCGITAITYYSRTEDFTYRGNHLAASIIMTVASIAGMCIMAIQPMNPATNFEIGYIAVSAIAVANVFGNVFVRTYVYIKSHIKKGC